MAGGIVPGQSTMAAFVCACAGGRRGRGRAFSRRRARANLDLTCDPWVLRRGGGARRGGSRKGSFMALRVRACAARILVGDPGGVGVSVCARACEREVESGPGMWEGAVRGVAFARGNGGGLLCVVSGGWAALRPPNGGRRAAEGPETGMDGHLVLPGLPSPGLFFRSSPVSAASGPWPARPRFRSGKFCDAEDSRRSGEGRDGEEGGMGRCVRGGAGLWRSKWNAARRLATRHGRLRLTWSQ